MSSEAGHIQITEFNKEVIPSINWMMEDLFCQYGVSLPWFMCDFDFPDFSQRPDWVSGYNFNLDWGAWGYWLVKFNEMLGLLFDEAHLPRWQMPDLSPGSWAFFNDYTEILYDNMQRHYVYGQSGTFTKDEVIEGETSGITGWYKWIDGDGYIHVANKKDSSGETVADFEEEKIVGADSGAYAYTYEGPTSPVTVNDIIFSDCNIFRYGIDFDSYENAWDKYQNSPSWNCWGSLCRSVRWKIYFDSPDTYRVYGDKCFLKFNTTNSDPRLSSALLRIYLHYCGGDNAVTGTDIHLNTYVQDYGDDVGTGDWSGGALADNTIVINSSDADSWIEIPLSSDEVNIGDYSKYKLSIKETDDDVYTGPLYKRITISDAQLKLIY